MFGEISLIFSIIAGHICARTATVQSQNYCTMANLELENFLELWNYSPDIFHSIKSKALSYRDEWIQFKVKLLKQIDYFECKKDDEDDKFFHEI